MARTDLTIDCATCPVQHVACADCMVTALGGGPPAWIPDHSRSAAEVAIDLGEDLPIDRRERAAITALVANGLVSATEATRARARREPWSSYREAVG